VGPFFRLLDIFCYSSSSSLSFVGISQCCESDVCLHPIVDLPISNQRGAVGNFSPAKVGPPTAAGSSDLIPLANHLRPPLQNTRPQDHQPETPRYLACDKQTPRPRGGSGSSDVCDLECLGAQWGRFRARCSFDECPVFGWGYCVCPLFGH
jgi:hypothetical protein